MRVRKSIAIVAVAACLASGSVWAGTKGTIRVGITIVPGCAADTRPAPTHDRPMKVDCSSRVPYRVTTSGNVPHPPHQRAVAPGEAASPRIATLTF